MINITVFLVIYILIHICLCSLNSNQLEGLFAFRTAYRTAANTSFGRIQYQNCTPQKSWMVIRHGTRTPGVKYIKFMKHRLPDMRDLIIKNWDENENKTILFKNWKANDLKEENEKFLTLEGAEEMILLAERMQSRFPKIFNGIYSNTSYYFKFTDTQRAKESFLNFATGLFGKQTAKEVWYPAPETGGDPLLRFYKLCHKWRRDIKKNPEFLKERNRFKESQHVKNSVKNIHTQLGLKEGSLTVDEIHNMYITCAFETAWSKNNKSPWCIPFSMEDLKVFEYMEDLKYYWRDGYGHELNYKQACVMFGSLFDYFKSKKTYPKVTAYFTHSGTLLKMLAHLGLYKDDRPLLADDFILNKDRKWRTSRIDSFATNLAFILFDCEGQDSILTMHQEKTIRLPACPNKDLCDMKSIEKYYFDSIKNCDFNLMCSLT